MPCGIGKELSAFQVEIEKHRVYNYEVLDFTKSSRKNTERKGHEGKVNDGRAAVEAYP